MYSVLSFNGLGFLTLLLAFYLQEGLGPGPSPEERGEVSNVFSFFNTKRVLVFISAKGSISFAVYTNAKIAGCICNTSFCVRYASRILRLIRLRSTAFLN